MSNRAKKPFSVASVVAIALVAALLIYALNRLPPDGRVDRVTWNRLVQAAEGGINEYPWE